MSNPGKLRQTDRRETPILARGGDGALDESLGQRLGGLHHPDAAPKPMIAGESHEGTGPRSGEADSRRRGIDTPIPNPDLHGSSNEVQSLPALGFGQDGPDSLEDPPSHQARVLEIDPPTRIDPSPPTEGRSELLSLRAWKSCSAEPGFPGPATPSERDGGRWRYRALRLRSSRNPRTGWR